MFLEGLDALDQQIVSLLIENNATLVCNNWGDALALSQQNMSQTLTAS